MTISPDDSVPAILSAGSYSIDPAALERIPADIRDQLLADLNRPSAQAVLGASSLAAYSIANRCHRCDAPATTQWQQHATPEAAEAHWAAQEQHIRSLANTLHPEQANYIADRTGPVTVAVHGCDENVVDAPHLTHNAECGGHGQCGCEPPDA